MNEEEFDQIVGELTVETEDGGDPITFADDNPVFSEVMTLLENHIKWPELAGVAAIITYLKSDLRELLNRLHKEVVE